MVHGNARLTPRTRLELVLQVQAGWPQAEVARQFRVSRTTVAKWVRRFATEGARGLDDRTSAPHQHPRTTPVALARRICAVRRQSGWGPHRIGWKLGIPHQTVYRVLKRAGLQRRAWMHRVTRQVVRYEHPAPGDLLHLDVKKLGRVPDGGGKRFAPGFAETHSGPRTSRSLGLDYIHVAVDDHSRYAYVEALPDERAGTTTAFLERALADFRRHGVQVRGVLTDNGKNYTSRQLRALAQAHGVVLKLTRPYRPQTNGKAERFIQILQAEWAYARPYRSNAERLAALPRCLYRYNHRRPHGGIGGAVPASRLQQPS